VVAYLTGGSNSLYTPYSRLSMHQVPTALFSAPDIPWTSLTPTANLSGTVQYTRRSGNVYVEMAGSKSGTSGAILATLPPGCWPAVQVIRPAVQAGGVQSGVFVDTVGNIKSDYGTGAYGGFSFPAA
jgi:hypothetical protein